MGLDSGSLEMLTHTATWKRRTGEDSWGNNAYAAAVNLPCFVLPSTSSLAAGEAANVEQLRRFTTELICDAVGVTPGDQIVLPDGRLTFVSDVRDTKDVDGTPLLHEVTVTSSEGA